MRNISDEINERLAFDMCKNCMIENAGFKIDRCYDCEKGLNMIDIRKADKVEVHKMICDDLHETYKAKNADYGDSFAKVRAKYPEAILIRLEDKMNRLEQLIIHGEQQVKDESINDTLLDMANYCIMELVERITNDREK